MATVISAYAPTLADQENKTRFYDELCEVVHSVPQNCQLFNVKHHHKISWKHPRSSHWHQLDLILVRKNHLNLVITRTYHSADCDTDHSLVRSKTRVTHQKFHSAKSPKETKSRVEQESRRCANEYWNTLCSDIQGARERGDMDTMQQMIRCAVGPQALKLAPIK